MRFIFTSGSVVVIRIFIYAHKVNQIIAGEGGRFIGVAGPIPTDGSIQDQDMIPNAGFINTFGCAEYFCTVHVPADFGGLPGWVRAYI